MAPCLSMYIYTPAHAQGIDFLLKHLHDNEQSCWFLSIFVAVICLNPLTPSEKIRQVLIGKRGKNGIDKGYWHSHSKMATNGCHMTFQRIYNRYH